jgi:hypothetical protein
LQLPNFLAVIRAPKPSRFVLERLPQWAPLLYASCPLQVLESVSSDAIHLREVRPLGPYWLPASWLLGFALLPLWFNRSATGLVTTGVLFSLGALLFWQGRPRTVRRTTLLLGPSGLETPAGGVTHQAVRARLTGSESLGGSAPRPVYQLLLESPKGDQLLLEHPDPQHLVRDARLLLAELKCPVVSDWGLPSAWQPWRTESSAQLEGRQGATNHVQRGGAAVTRRAPAKLTVRSVPWARSLALVFCITGATYAVLALTLAAHFRSSHPENSLSLLLGCAVLALHVLWIAVLLTTKLHIVVEPGAVLLETSTLGYRFRRLELQQVRFASALAPAGDFSRHLALGNQELFATVPCSNAGAREAAAFLRDHLPES